MLRFVLGRSGYGKSEYLRRRFVELAKGGDDKLLCIVPDQITFETEAAFLDLLGPADSGRILVLGFSRMCDFVFERTGSRFASFADEGIRNMVMSIAIDKVAEELQVFEKRRNSRDLCEIMLTAVKEYKKCGISSDILLSTADMVGDDTLAKKLADTALVYDAYNAVMAQSYMDPLDSLTKLSELLIDHPVFEGYTVAMDAFYGFTAQEYDVIERLMTQSKDIYIALTDDMSDGGDTSLFYTPQRTRSRLSELARRNSVDIAPYIELGEPYRFTYPELAAAEEGLYRLDKPVFDGDAEHICVYKASDIYDECDFVARTIRRLTEDGYRYRDIAVIARDTSKYAGILDIALDKYDICYFMDEPQNIDAVPVVRLVSSAFDVVTRGFQREDVLTLLKTGLCSYSVEDIADFENYLYVWDISGKGFYEQFTANPSGFSDEFSDTEREQLNRIEALRADIITKLRAFAFGVRDTDGKHIAKALMKLLYALKCDDNIVRMCDALEAQGDVALSEELVRMWNVLCGILDKTVAVLGDRAITPGRFAELLYVNISNTEVATIPRGLDEVDVSSADRGMLSPKKAVFVIGALDGEFPRTPVEAGVFTDSERVILKGLQLPLSDSVGELFSTELYYAYSAVTAPSEMLYLSYCSADLKGEQQRPSDMISELSGTVPRLRTIDSITVPPQERLLSKRAAFDYLIRRYKSSADDINALKSYFADDEDFGAIIRSITKAAQRGRRRVNSSELTRALFGETMQLSATRIDVYHKCPFMYFCEYGLRARERRRATIDALEYGTLIHYIFETFFREHDRDSYSQLDEPVVAEEVSRLLDEYMDRHFGGVGGKSSRFLYLYYRIKSTAVKLVMHLIEELRQSDFTPVDFELGVGEDIPEYRVELADGLSLAVRGSVDRVDRCVKDGVPYIRVVDYKTGKKKFNLYDIIYGINLQMFLYMSAIRSGAEERYGEGIQPAGVLYMPAVSASVSVDADTDEDKIRAELLKEYTMRGVLLNDIDVLTSMEHDRNGVYIPVAFKGDTVRAGADNLATLEELGSIFRRVDVLLGQMAQSLYDGDVDALPLKGAYDGCEYCRYRSVCRRREEDPCREGAPMSKDEFYSNISEEAKDDEA